MKTVSEKLAARLYKEFPELGIKPHTELVRQRPDPYCPKGEPQVKWCRENWTESGRYNEALKVEMANKLKEINYWQTNYGG